MGYKLKQRDEREMRLGDGSRAAWVMREKTTGAERNEPKMKSKEIRKKLWNLQIRDGTLAFRCGLTTLCIGSGLPRPLSVFGFYLSI